MPQNHYEVLNIDPVLWSQSQQPTVLKNAYRAALLKHHPDKAINTGRTETTSSAVHTNNPSIDDITLAYQTLSDPVARAEYDRKLRLAIEKSNNDRKQDARTVGLEVIDLDDMEYDESKNIWTRDCRCGSEGGFVVSEADLEKASEEASQIGSHHELLVGCAGCSLALRVGFAVAED